MSNEEELSTMAQRGVDTAKELSSSAFEKATRAAQASQGYFDHFCQQSKKLGGHSCATTKHYWNNVPLLRWSVYIFAAFLAIPLALFIGWIVITLGFVSTIAGTGVVVSEGFFGFCGLAVFLPTAGFFAFVAFIIACFAVLTWGGLQGTNIILSKLGIIDRKDLMEYSKQKAASAKGTLQSDYQQHSR